MKRSLDFFIFDQIVFLRSGFRFFYLYFLLLIISSLVVIHFFWTGSYHTSDFPFFLSGSYHDTSGDPKFLLWIMIILNSMIWSFWSKLRIILYHEKKNDLHLLIIFLIKISVNLLTLQKSAIENEIIFLSKIFFRNFDFKNECYKEFGDYNEKICRVWRNRVSQKIIFKAVWTHDSNPAA